MWRVEGVERAKMAGYQIILVGSTLSIVLSHVALLNSTFGVFFVMDIVLFFSRVIPLFILQFGCLL